MNDTFGKYFLRLIQGFCLAFGSKLGIVDEHSLSKYHGRLIELGFYAKFRNSIDRTCKSIRLNLEVFGGDFFIGSLSSKDVLLGAKQKVLLTTVYSSTFKKVISHHQLYQLKCVYPIPREFRRDLEEVCSLNFNHFLCQSLMLLLHLKMTAKAFKRFFALLILSFAKVKDKSSFDREVKGIFVANLPTECFPKSKDHSHTFIDWLTQRDTTFTHLVHDNKSIMELRELRDGRKLIYSPLLLVGTEIRSVVYAFSTLVFGLFRSFKSFKLFSACLIQIDELYLACLFNRKMDAFAIRDVIFMNTEVVLRPLWSIELENKGINVVLAHYSASAEPSESFGMQNRDGIWHLSSWSKSWVVDDVQIELALTISPFYAKNFEVVGVPMWSGEIFRSIIPKHKLVISVFDTYIRTHTTFSASVIDDLGWDKFELEWTFIFDILSVVDPESTIVFHKRKRPLHDFNSEIRLRNSKRLKELFGSIYCEVPEKYSAESLVEVSDLVISKPISTAGIIAKEYGCESVYYDPSGNLVNEEVALRGIKLLHTSNDLRQVIGNLKHQR